MTDTTTRQLEPGPPTANVASGNIELPPETVAKLDDLEPIT